MSHTSRLLSALKQIAEVHLGGDRELLQRLISATQDPRVSICVDYGESKIKEILRYFYFQVVATPSVEAFTLRMFVMSTGNILVFPQSAGSDDVAVMRAEDPESWVANLLQSIEVDERVISQASDPIIDPSLTFGLGMIYGRILGKLGLI